MKLQGLVHWQLLGGGHQHNAGLDGIAELGPGPLGIPAQ